MCRIWFLMERSNDFWNCKFCVFQFSWFLEFFHFFYFFQFFHFFWYRTFVRDENVQPRPLHWCTHMLGQRTVARKNETQNANQKWTENVSHLQDLTQSNGFQTREFLAISNVARTWQTQSRSVARALARSLSAQWRDMTWDGRAQRSIAQHSMLCCAMLCYAAMHFFPCTLPRQHTTNPKRIKNWKKNP